MISWGFRLQRPLWQYLLSIVWPSCTEPCCAWVIHFLRFRFIAFVVHVYLISDRAISIIACPLSITRAILTLSNLCLCLVLSNLESALTIAMLFACTPCALHYVTRLEFAISCGHSHSDGRKRWSFDMWVVSPWRTKLRGSLAKHRMHKKKSIYIWWVILKI